ncbi:hypothetical protein D3C83_324870 [compost metagenome]
MACTRARSWSIFAWLSTICSSSVAFIFTAVKPRAATSFAAAAVSAGRSPPIHE